MMLGQIFVSAPFVREAREMSLLYFLHQVHLCGGITALTSIQHGLQVRLHLVDNDS